LKIDVTGLPAERYLFAPSPLGELAAMLHALVEPAHHPSLHSWVAATMSSLKPELSERVLQAQLLWRSARADFLIPGLPRATLNEELDDLDRLDDETYVNAALVTTSCGSKPQLRIGSPLVDASARARATELALARGPQQAEFAERLLTDPPAVRTWVRRLLEDCEQAFFAETWSRVQSQLAADSRHKLDVFARHGLSAALAAISPSVTASAEGNQIVVDKLQDAWTIAAGRGVTFSPTAFGRPHLLVVHTPGWRPVVQYPTTEPRTPQPIPLDLVQSRLEALAHPVRQRLARTLARGPHSTVELAGAWNLTAPEVSRHLAVLRKAGLTRVGRRGRYVLYELDLAACARLGADFVEAILR
jgi:DNA-binding transcriptional ArsR family regulator